MTKNQIKSKLLKKKINVRKAFFELYPVYEIGEENLSMERYE